MADLYEVIIGTGMRQGEALALRWSDVHQQSQMDHVFVPKHNLGALIQSCGSEGATMDQIIESVQDASDGIYGKVDPLIRVINGYTVTIRGAMINGVFKIGTAFIP